MGRKRYIIETEKVKERKKEKQRKESKKSKKEIEQIVADIFADVCALKYHTSIRHVHIFAQWGRVT